MRYYSILLSFQFILYANFTFCQPTIVNPKLFDEKDPLETIIQTDMINLLGNRDAEPEYQDATIIFNNINGETETFDLKIQTRGNFRRDSAHCDFPPIRINFKKKQIINTHFEGNEKIKIVTHCKTAVPEFDQFVSREFLTYKIYNLLTPLSFDVRLAKITYEDTKGQLKPIERIGFFIEDIDHLAARNNMSEHDDTIRILNLDKKNAILLSIFQYMIGNTDWIVNLSKNLKTITDGNQFYAIPYDFDYTMIVNADYSLGGGTSYLSSPSRDYRGLCYNVDELNPVIEEILNKKKDINKLISKTKLLDYNSKQHMLDFLSQFYFISKSDKRIQENILSKCNESN